MARVLELRRSIRILADHGNMLQGKCVVRSSTDISLTTLNSRERALGDYPPAGQILPLEPIIRRDRIGPRLQILTAKGFEWVDAQIPIPHLPPELEGFRLLHVSDIHARRLWDPAWDELIARVQADPPDFIVYTGDFVDNKQKTRQSMPLVRRLVNSLKSRLGAAAILGNHDGDLLGPPLASLNLTLLDHRRLALHSGSATLEFIGVAGVDRKDFDPVFLRSLGRKGPGTVRIALSHYPDLIRRSRFLELDLFLAGHTHGGQVCLPGGIPIIRHDSLPAKLISGIHRVYDTWLVSNPGIGFSGLPVRLFCPAQVIEIRLRRYPKA
jgi:predicted MPP superfamily phosphohydrolase